MVQRTYPTAVQRAGALALVLPPDDAVAESPDLLLDRSSLMYDLLEPGAVASLLTDHRAGKDDNHKVLFSLAMFEQWLRGVRGSQTSSPTAQVAH